MHTVHLPVDAKKESGFMAAAMGIMFSVDKPTPGVSASDIATIDTFFESLQWDKTTDDVKAPLVEKVPYGKLMMMFDMRNRWTYKGSVTTPPCAQNVYWNVLKTIYPIKQKHVDMFKKQLKRVDGLDKTGNWREILPLTEEHNPVILFSN
jgi:carbonic anhydrase